MHIFHALGSKYSSQAQSFTQSCLTIHVIDTFMNDLNCTRFYQFINLVFFFEKTKSVQEICLYYSFP